MKIQLAKTFTSLAFLLVASVYPSLPQDVPTDLKSPKPAEAESQPAAVPATPQAPPATEEKAPPAAAPKPRLATSVGPVAPPPPAEDEFKVSSEVEMVLLDASVKDSRGGFVSGLKKENFKVYENKVEQTVSAFSAQDTPVTVGLVVDNSGSVRPKKPEIVTAALTFVTQSNPQDEMFIVNFNDKVMMGLPEGVSMTGDASMLRQALLLTRPQGRTALYDAIKTALAHLEKGRFEKKTLVVISDGGDNASELSREEVMRLAESSPATIYTVGIFNPEDKDKNPGVLRQLAHITGGEAFMPGGIEQLVGVCEKIAHDIRNRYTVGYTPSNLVLDGKVRHLKVVASADDGRKLEVRTRTYYVARPHATSEISERSRKRK